jgi:hypothetical protein
MERSDGDASIGQRRETAPRDKHWNRSVRCARRSRGEEIFGIRHANRVGDGGVEAPRRYTCRSTLASLWVLHSV